MVEFNQEEQVLGILKDLYQDGQSKSQVLKDLISLSARNNKLKSDINKKIIRTDEIEVQRNQIREAIIDHIDSLDEAAMIMLEKYKFNERCLNKRKRRIEYEKYVLVFMAAIFFITIAVYAYVFASKKRNLFQTNNLPIDEYKYIDSNEHSQAEPGDSAYSANNKESNLAMVKKKEIFFEGTIFPEIIPDALTVNKKPTGSAVKITYSNSIIEDKQTGLFYYPGGKVLLLINGRLCLEFGVIKETPRFGNQESWVVNYIDKTIYDQVIIHSETIKLEILKCLD